MPKTSLVNFPDSDCEAKRTSFLEVLLITSKTDSDSLRDNLLFKKALLVNSPGPASSKPNEKPRYYLALKEASKEDGDLSDDK